MARSSWLWIATAAALVGCTARGPGPGAVTEARDGAAQLFRAYSAAVAEGRWEDVAALYADDPRFLWLEDGRVAYRSREEVRRALATLGSAFIGARTEFSAVDVAPLAPDLAHATARVRQTFAGAGGESFTFQVALSAVLVRTGDGWRFLRGHTSTVRETEEAR